MPPGQSKVRYARRRRGSMKYHDICVHRCTSAATSISTSTSTKCSKLSKNCNRSSSILLYLCIGPQASQTCGAKHLHFLLVASTVAKNPFIGRLVDAESTGQLAGRQISRPSWTSRDGQHVSPLKGQP